MLDLKPQLPITVILLLQTWGPPSEIVVQMLHTCLTLGRHGSALIINSCFLHHKSDGNFAGIDSLVIQMNHLPCPELELPPAK